MEKGLRECCRSMRIGKILIRRDQETKLPRVRVGGSVGSVSGEGVRCVCVCVYGV